MADRRRRDLGKRAARRHASALLNCGWRWQAPAAVTRAVKQRGGARQHSSIAANVGRGLSRERSAVLQVGRKKTVAGGRRRTIATSGDRQRRRGRGLTYSSVAGRKVTSAGDGGRFIEDLVVIIRNCSNFRCPGLC